MRGRFNMAGTDLGIHIMDLAERVRSAGLPEDLPQTLDVSHIFKGVPSAFPNGCHIAEVEVDPETGVVEIVSYATVNDFGVLVNPMLVAGQAHGGIAQGIGQALMEKRRLRRGRTDADWIVHGLRAAARVRSSVAGL